MKKLFILLIAMLSFNCLKSQDTIQRWQDVPIYCKITKVTSMNIFYTVNKIGKTIPLAEVSYYSKPNNTEEIVGNANINLLKMDEFVQIPQRTWSLFGLISFRTELEGFDDSNSMLLEMKSKGYKLISTAHYSNVGFLIAFCSKTVFIFEKTR